MVTYPRAPVSQPESANLKKTQLDDSAPCVSHPPPGAFAVTARIEMLKGRWEYLRPLKTQACNGFIAASAQVPLIEASPKPRAGKVRTTHSENMAKIGIQEGVNNWGQLFSPFQITTLAEDTRVLNDG